MTKHLLHALALLAIAGPLAAQSDSGTVIVTVAEPMGPVSGAMIRSGNRNAMTDPEGRARLVLPAGRRTLSLARIGYVPKRVEVVVVADSIVTLAVELAMEDMEHMEMEEMVVTTTRIERLAGETPTRVEVIDEMEVDENTQMSPSGITMLLNETPGLRVHHASPALGTGSVRIHGLPGQYTAMLADGLPLYGGASSALGPLDISPVDLQRVEIIKGAASALYGGQALGGVINLVSKPPSGRNQLLLNKRTMGVSDAAAWLSRRFSERTGLSLLLSGTIQEGADPDDDGWFDQPRARRWGVRPRFTAVDSGGRSLFVTAGYGYDSRRGGALEGSTAAGVPSVEEGLTGHRADIGAMLRLPSGEAAHVAMRLALQTNGRRRAFASAPPERDRISTGFLEVTRSHAGSRHGIMVGAALQLDAYRNRMNDGYDREWVTPGIFGTVERTIGAVTVSASLRADAHSSAGLRLTERLAVLARPSEGWSIRLSGGTGYAAASALNEETEVMGLRTVQRGAVLDHERSFGTTLDLNGRLAGAEFLVTGHASFIHDAVQLADTVLVNAAGVTRIGGVETAAIWRFRGGKFLLTYGYARGSRTDAMTGAREHVPLLARHRIGGDLMFEKPGVYRGGIEGIWHGVQSLDDDPNRTESRPYLYLMAIGARQLGRFELVLNFENLLNVRQTDHAPLARAIPGNGGRLTTDVWAPLEGFMANAAIRYSW